MEVGRTCGECRSRPQMSWVTTSKRATRLTWYNVAQDRDRWKSSKEPIYLKKIN